MSKLNNLKKTKEEINLIESNIESFQDLIEISNEEEIINLFKEIENDILRVGELKLLTLLNNEYDNEDAIFEIHSGAGGTEACDWVLMLSRMYQRYFDNNDFKVEILDYLDGDEAGLKSITFSVKGEYAYGFLKSEIGVHRLVRISPFDSNARRHTSFASVLVTPLIDKDINIEINPNDLRIDVYRSSGKGGQGVNTTDSAVRITHLPTNIVVTCQSERSQIQNKETALKLLKNKLYLLEQEKQEQEKNSNYKEQKNIEFGSQIRSYVMAPYQLVKDHRTNYEETDVEKVMNGKIENFIEEYLKKGNNEKENI
jgi:peptide chain release factor 2